MRKWQNMIKKNDKDEIGNILLKHVLPVYNLAPLLIHLWLITIRFSGHWHERSKQKKKGVNNKDFFKWV